MPTILFRHVLTLVAIAVLASCGSGEPPPSSDSDAVDVSESQFQSKLNALGIPLMLPRGRAILVNVPSYELVALEDGEPVFWSRVIVGKPETRTPRIDTATSSVIFWPSWRPTPEMVASGEVPDRIFPPGPRNPMGLLAITLDTRLGIAMHDTNQRYLFERERRAFSHGCIRVQKWDTLAAWLLDRDEDWVRTLSVGPTTQRLGAPRVPVLIRHFTVFPTEDGAVGRYADVYGLGSTSAAYLTARKSAGPPNAEFQPDRACRIPT